MWWSDFHFLRPWWLLLLLLALVLPFFTARRISRKSSWDRVIDAHLLPYVLKERKPPRSFSLQSLWLALFIALTSLALAGPTLNKIPSEVSFLKAPLIICLEVSEHMLARDIDPSRFKRAIYKIEDLLKAYPGAEVALIAFAGDAHLAVPLSSDYNTVLSMAKELTPDVMPIRGVNLMSALERAADISKKNPRARVVVLTSSNFDSDNFASKSPLSGPVTIWAFATDAGGPLELADGRFEQRQGGQVTISKLRHDYLDKLDGTTNMSTLLYTPNQTDVMKIIAGLSSDADAQTKRDEQFDEWYDLGPFVAVVAMLVFLGAVFFGREVFLLATLLIMLPSEKTHASIDEWFLRPDQRAQRALDNNDPQTAAELFPDHFRKGIASYRAKNYDQAIEHLGQVNTPDGFYNLGNAFAQKGQYQEAIKAYDNALKLDPSNADAQANKELLEKAQRNEQQQKKDNNQSDSQKDKQEEENKEPNQSDNQKSQNSDEQEKDKGQNNPSSNKENEQSENKSSQSQQEKSEQKQQDSAQAEQGADKKQTKKDEKAARIEEQPKDQLDPETKYYFQRLEQNNNFFLKRKFLYESRKRQEGK